VYVRGKLGDVATPAAVGGLSWNNRQSCEVSTFIVGARVLRVHMCVCVRACSLARLHGFMKRVVKTRQTRTRQKR